MQRRESFKRGNLILFESDNIIPVLCSSGNGNRFYNRDKNILRGNIDTDIPMESAVPVL